jgi:hypothetical protein
MKDTASRAYDKGQEYAGDYSKKVDKGAKKLGEVRNHKADIMTCFLFMKANSVARALIRLTTSLRKGLRRLTRLARMSLRKAPRSLARFVFICG